MQKAISGADKAWEEKGYNNDTMKDWLNEDEASYGKQISDRY